MKKLFGYVAMVLLIIAYNAFDETDSQSIEKQEGITITAKLAPKTVSTKAVSDQGTTIKVVWAQNEHMAILYSIGSTKYVSDAEIISVDASTGEATISFTVNGSTPDNTVCTIVYPFSAAKDDYSGVKTYAELLSEQNGTLNANLDVRVGTGNIRTATPSLEVNTQPAAQFAIFKFAFGFCPLVFSIKSGGTAVTTVTPSAATSATQNLYVAVPPTASVAKYEFMAYDNTNKYTKSISSTTPISSGYYYQTTLSWNATALTTKSLGSATEDIYVSTDSRLSGTLNENVKVTIASGATVVIDNASIEGKNNNSYKWAGITCEGDAKIILSGNNTIKGFYEDYPGIFIAENKTLTIQGTGSLNASSNGYAPGIGAGWNMHCGFIVIDGGDITATGGKNSAGIGGSTGSQVGGISNNVTKVIATMGEQGINGIGAGRGSNSRCGTITFGDVMISQYEAAGTIWYTDIPASGEAVGRLTFTKSSDGKTWTLTPVSE